MYINTVMPLAGGQGGISPPGIWDGQLILFQPWWADYAHLIISCPPGFERHLLKTYVHSVQIKWKCPFMISFPVSDAPNFQFW